MTDLRIALEGPLKPHHAPLLLARDAGIFKGRDLSVSWIESDRTNNSLRVLLDGDSQLALTRPLNLVSEFLTGTEIIGIARYFHTDSGVMYRTVPEVEKPCDLTEENSILLSCITQNEAEIILEFMAERDGHDSISLKSSQFDRPEAAPLETFYRGNHDIFITAGVIPEGVQMEQADFEVDFWFYDEYSIPANGDLVIATTRELANNSPNKIKDFVHSLHDGVNVLRNDADRGRELIRNNFEGILSQPGGRALLYTSFSELTTNFSQDFQTYTDWGEFLDEHGDVGGFVDVDRLIDERFIPLDSVPY